jgi:hypothetical protein
VAGLSRLLPGRAPGGHRANLGSAVRPDLGCARTGRRTGKSAGRLAHLILHPITWATHPSCYLETSTSPSCGVAGTSHAGSSRQSLLSLTGSAPPASTGLLRSTTHRHVRCTTPLPIGHRLSYTGAELDWKIRAIRPSGGCPGPIRCAAPRQRSRCSPTSPAPLVDAAARVSSDGRVVAAARPRSTRN